MLGEGDVDYRIEAEFVPSISTRKGVLAAAREGMIPIRNVSLAGRSFILFKERCILRNS